MKSILAILPTSLLLAIPIALLSPGDFLRGWLAAALLLFLCSSGLWAAWRWGGAGRRLALLVALAFFLRLGVGIGLGQAYRLWGYDTAVYKSGYLFPDALKRDSEAYQVGVSGARLLINPDLQLGSDQYGGLGLLSAAVYRVLSPDAHRPALILILGAAFFALGVPFLNKALAWRWNERIGAIALWIYLLYPDGIFFTSSQMREPFVIGLSAVVFWAVLAWGTDKRGALLAGLPAAAGMLLMSTRSAAFLLGVLALLFLLEYLAGHPDRRWRSLGWTGLGLGLILAALLTRAWFREVADWDLLVTQRSSGMVNARIEELGEVLRIPFLMVYGLAQPVLPAAIAEPSIPLAKTILILRSAGWYALAPLLLYAAFSLLPFGAGKILASAERRRMAGIVLATLVWACVASVRAGGDLTDNPRYRLLFLILMVVAAAWGADRAIRLRDPWLARWLLVEAIFLVLFSLWYIGRYTQVIRHPPFLLIVGLIVGLSALVLGGGLIYDRRRRVKQAGKRGIE